MVFNLRMIGQSSSINDIPRYILEIYSQRILMTAWNKVKQWDRAEKGDQMVADMHTKVGLKATSKLFITRIELKMQVIPTSVVL